MKTSQKLSKILFEYSAYLSSKMDLAPREFERDIITALGAVDYVHAVQLIRDLYEIKESLIEASNNLEDINYLLEPFRKICRDAHE
jgi:hypothetical protein